MREFLEVMTTDYDYHPSQRLKVSVIVPNYRHAEFLEDRLRSIFAQTLRPHEIIFLDDASPDDSVEVARRLAPLAPVPMKIVVNEQNNGSTFRQWMKGLSLATGDLIWIAESDDHCHPEFLERLVPEFYDPDVVLAYCQSAIIGPEGELSADTFLAHTDDISANDGDRATPSPASRRSSWPSARRTRFPTPAPSSFAGPRASISPTSW